MKKIHICFFYITLVCWFTLSCNPKIGDKTVPQTAKEIVKEEIPSLTNYDFKTVPNDPLGTQIYTLKNGLKLYLSVNEDEPRIQTQVAVRAGSKNDPADATGLAHYLEHMLFKGTSEVGALDWEKEKVLLQEISDLYEEHRNTTDPAQRKRLYNRIDSVSNLAAKLVSANEYDKILGSMGATGTNAYTWVEQTVYVNDIPANELERWMRVESKRFNELVLRLFHTELEAVYEEFNRGQDSDIRKRYKAIFEGLFPRHEYGTQTTIGTGDHLKNPSHVKIHNYFDTYYKPNNMAIVLAGDFDPAEAVKFAEKYFGGYQAAEIPAYTFEEQPQFIGPIKQEVLGPESKAIDLAWRFDGMNSADPIMLMMLTGILNNGQAGLMDINLLQKQKVLSANADYIPLKDYSIFMVSGEPREGQDLKELQKILIAEINKLKFGDFDDWLLDAVVKDYKLSEIRANESNNARVSAMTNAFVTGLDWDRYVNRFQELEKITKEDVMEFARKHLGLNYVVVYKYEGEDPNTVKVEKPEITPIEVNREQSSEFTSALLAEEAPRLTPKFVDFKKEIQHFELSNGLGLDYIENKSNNTFSLDYIVEMGKNSNKKLPLAINYLPYLGTDKYTAEELQKEFFKLGLSFSVYAGNERVYVTLSGLDESLEEGVALFEHVLANVQADEAALKNVVSDILTGRENNKKDKRYILRNGMTSYAKYGKNSAFTDVIPENELKSISSADLISNIKSLNSYDHTIFYYGSKSPATVKAILNKHHNAPSNLKPVTQATVYKELEQMKDEVYFVDFQMVQAEVYLVSKGTPNFSLDEYIMSEMYNTYFGRGLSSIVFQEIRESKALAYSAFAYYASPSKKDRAHYMQAYVGTQVDKLKDAIPALMEIIEDMPLAQAQFDAAKESILKQIESERITKTAIYWNNVSNNRKGIEHDIREDVYKRMQTITLDDLKAFHEKHVKGRNYTFLVMGNKESVDMNFLKTLGPVKELELKEVFGY